MKIKKKKLEDVINITEEIKRLTHKQITQSIVKICKSLAESVKSHNFAKVRQLDTELQKSVYGQTMLSESKKTETLDETVLISLHNINQIQENIAESGCDTYVESKLRNVKTQLEMIRYYTEYLKASKK